MPSELTSINDITPELLDRTVEVRAYRKKDRIKVKFRTKKHLYTLIVNEGEYRNLESMIKDKGLEIGIAANHVRVPLE